MSEYGDKAVAAVDAILGVNTHRTASLDIARGGITAITFALLDLAAAIREHV